MQRDNELTDFIAQSDEQVAQARRAIGEMEEAQREMQARQQGWQAQLAQLRHLRDDEMHHYAQQQVTAAQERPPLPAPDVAVDKATQFMRIVRRRRAIV